MSIWLWEMLLERAESLQNNFIFLPKMRRGPTHITKDHLRLQKKMSSIHIFKIAEGRETGRDFNQPVRGDENPNGKMQRMKSI